MTTSGWVELRNPVDSSVPFQLFRDEGRTFLQWLGETILRTFLHGRLIVVHLICRDSLKYSDSLNVGFLNGKYITKLHTTIYNLILFIALLLT